MKITVNSAIIIYSDKIYLELLLKELDKTNLLEVIKKNHSSSYINSLYSEQSNKINYEYSKCEISMKYFRNQSIDLLSYNFIKLYYVIKIKETQKIIGSIEISINDLNASIGLFIDESYSNKGFGSASVKCILNFLKNNSNIKTVIWECYKYNTNSLKIAKNCGFKYSHDKQDDTNRIISSFFLELN